MPEQKENKPKLTRRNFLIHAAGAAFGLACFSPIDAICSLPTTRSLSFYHTHTGETFEVSTHNGRYSKRDRKKLITFLRDFRTGDTHSMDIRLFSTLMRIQDVTGSKGVYEVISGYRSPQTNRMLRSRSNGVAKSSYHMKGQALDVRLSDVKTSDLRDIARKLQTGGVGYYKRSDFVHIDTGPVRFW